MPLIVEDGSIVPGANSYVTVAEVRDYADRRGMVLPTQDLDVERSIIRRMDWFEAFRFPNVRATAEQVLSFPRDRIDVDGVVYLSAEIPPIVKQILCEASCLAQDFDLMPNIAGSENGSMKRVRAEVEVEWFQPTGAWEFLPKTPYLNSLMTKLCANGGGWGQLTVVRA